MGRLLLWIAKSCQTASPCSTHARHGHMVAKEVDLSVNYHASRFLVMMSAERPRNMEETTKRCEWFVGFSSA
jgi:hypothetical protein